MIAEPLRDSLRSVWLINNRVTLYLIENLSDTLWKAKAPGAPRRTFR
ncbi:MAG: hypothetical protein ACRENP_17910 [Longimicrobiales bacterium]